MGVGAGSKLCNAKQLPCSTGGTTTSGAWANANCWGPPSAAGDGAAGLVSPSRNSAQRLSA